MKYLYLLILKIAFFSYLNANELVLIANGINKIDKKTVMKIYKGKIVEINGQSIIPINITKQDIKESFLKDYLKMNNEKYLAYWTVRQYIGKGIAPKELKNSKEIFNFIEKNKGAIGYIDENELSNNPKIKNFILSVNK